MKRQMTITNHAVLRYLERINGVDVEGCRKHLEEVFESGSMQQIIEFAGDTSCKVKSNGITYCVRNRCVTTCYPM